jgi:DNA repair protein SbcD/Mre11
LKILCTADIHIGRRSSRLLPGADPRVHSAAEAWLRITERAVQDRVDLLLVAGDLVDRANRFSASSRRASPS